VDEKPDDTRLKEALLLNRAACNLELRASFLPSVLLLPFINVAQFNGWRLENYGSVLRDCAAIIAANPCASKAYYRAGLALLALERADEALDVCTHVGECVAGDAGFKTLRARAEKQREELKRKEEERRERARRANEEKRKMDVAFAVRFSLS
jgi:hypothetical protein